VLKINDVAVEWRLVEGEIVGLDLASEEYVAVNRSGTALWAMLAAGATTAALVEELTRTFEVPESAARSDVDAFVASLRDRGFLTTA
jgi:hypothetical protein